MLLGLRYTMLLGGYSVCLFLHLTCRAIIGFFIGFLSLADVAMDRIHA
jgi:hypothetical protein